MKTNIWIVCPCFFDATSFSHTSEEVAKELAKHFPELSVKFLLIDDSAGADPELEGIRISSGLSTVRMPYNMGHQGAIVFALRLLGRDISEKDLIVTMDADGEDRPVDVPALIAKMLEKSPAPLHAVLAWRTYRRETLPFKIGYFCFRMVFGLLTGRVVKNGNFACFRGSFLKELIFHPHFDHCFSSTFLSLPLNVALVPLPRGIRSFGKSKMNYLSLVSHGIRMLMPFSEKIAIRGVLLTAFLAFAGGVGVLLTLALFPQATLMAILIFFTGISFLGMFCLLFATFSQAKAASLSRLFSLTQGSPEWREICPK